MINVMEVIGLLMAIAIPGGIVLLVIGMCRATAKPTPEMDSKC